MIILIMEHLKTWRKLSEPPFVAIAHCSTSLVDRSLENLMFLCLSKVPKINKKIQTKCNTSQQTIYLKTWAWVFANQTSKGGDKQRTIAKTLTIEKKKQKLRSSNTSPMFFHPGLPLRSVTGTEAPGTIWRGWTSDVVFSGWFINLHRGRVGGWFEGWLAFQAVPFVFVSLDGASLTNW